MMANNNFGIIATVKSYVTVNYNTTGVKDHLVLTDVFYAGYKNYCSENNHVAGSRVNVGRIMSKLGIRANVRVGGSAGTGQRSAYSGILARDHSLIVKSAKNSKVPKPSKVTSPTAKSPTLPSSSKDQPKKSRSTGPSREAIRKGVVQDIKKNFNDFLNNSFEVTSLPSDNIPADDFYASYNKYCCTNNLLVGSKVHIGRLLGKMGVRADARVGQKCLYTGLRKIGCYLSQENTEKSGSVDIGCSPASSRAPPKHPRSKGPSAASVRRTNVDDITKNFSKFLYDNFEVSYLPFDKVPAEDLYASYKNYCCSKDLAVGSKVMVGRLLARMGIRANLRGQKYLYAGLRKIDSSCYLSQLCPLPKFNVNSWTFSMAAENVDHSPKFTVDDDGESLSEPQTFYKYFDCMFEWWLEKYEGLA